MKKLYFLLLLVSSIVARAQVINFPDANFKAKLLQPNVAFDFGMENPITIDANGDGEIEVGEVAAVSFLNVSNANISSLMGISYFTNLARLDCDHNLLINIVIGSSNPMLEYLDCSHNLLQSISVDPSIALKTLLAGYNQLAGIDAVDVHYNHTYDSDYESHYPPYVDFSYNNITSFTVNEGYDTLNCSHNPLTAFNLNGAYIGRLNLNATSLSSIAGTGHLKYADFQNCQFSLLDLSNISFYSFHGGSRIYIGNNPFDKIAFGESCPDNLSYTSTNAFLDLTNYRGYHRCNPDDPYQEQSGNIKIFDSPNLSFIGLKNGFNYGFINCNIQTSGESWTQSSLQLEIVNCPALSFMCVDEGEREHIQEKIIALGLQNQVQVNSYCSFVPGGTFYTISGNTTVDADGNGCDTGDAGIANFKFSITNGSITGEIISNDTGNYTMPLQAGAYTITPLLENAAYFNVSPTNLAVDFPANASPMTQNFCVTPNGTHTDLEISVVPLGISRPGFDSKYKIIYKNKGNQIQSGSIYFNYDDGVLDFVSSEPSIVSQAPSVLLLEYDALQPFDSGYFIVTFNANSPMETPALHGGDILNFTASIVSGPTEETPDDNSFALHQVVVNSLDPNDKICLEGSAITPNMVGKYVHYVIRFENTGTANAQNIVVKDIIDTSKFDVDSLTPVDGSAPFVTRINGDKVEFIFENINLPFDDANNDGYVAFKIKTKPTLVLGDTFSNTASIYFDYNFPIVTNTATTTVALLAAADFDFDSYFSIAPNPAQNFLNIHHKKDISVSSVSIYNVLGQLVLVVPNAQEISKIDVSVLKTGSYFLKINSDRGTSGIKFIKN